MKSPSPVPHQFLWRRENLPAGQEACCYLGVLVVLPYLPPADQSLYQIQLCLVSDLNGPTLFRREFKGVTERCAALTSCAGVKTWGHTYPNPHYLQPFPPPRTPAHLRARGLLCSTEAVGGFPARPAKPPEQTCLGLESLPSRNCLEKEEQVALVAGHGWGGVSKGCLTTVLGSEAGGSQLQRLSAETPSQTSLL